MKTNIFIGVAALLAASALAIPLPINNGVLTGTLNANAQAVTNVAALTFADGTVQSTAGGGGGAVIPGFSGTVTNLTETVVTTTGPNLIPPGTQFGSTGCGVNGVLFPISLQANVSYLLILGPNELGPPAVPGGPIYPAIYFLDGGCYGYQLSAATNVLNFPYPENNYTIGFGSYNFNGLATFTLQQVTTSVIRSFNLTTFSNGVAQTNSGLGDAWDAPPAAVPAGVQYGGPMMFDYYMGCTNILSDGIGDLLIQDGGSIYVAAADSQGFQYPLSGQQMTTIASGSIICSEGPGYQGELTDSMGLQGNAGQMMVANGDGSWTWGGPGWGASFYAPGCYSDSITEYGGNSMFGPNCWGITDYGGNSFFAPDCNGVLDNAGWCIFGPDCQSMSANGPNSFFGPGCNDLADAGNSFYAANCSDVTENSGYSFFSPGCDGIVDWTGRSFFGPACESVTSGGPGTFYGPACVGITEYAGFDFFAANCNAINENSANGNCFYSPGCGGINQYGNGDSFYGPGCDTITDNGGYSLFGPGCGSITASGSGSFFGPNCYNVCAGSGTFYCGGGYNVSDSGQSCFYGPGCQDLVSSSAYSAYFAVTDGGTIANCTGVLVVGDNSTAVNLANETSLIVAGSYQIGVGTNNVRFKTDGKRIIPTVPVALTNGVTTVEGTIFYPHTLAGALVWTTNSAHD